MVCAEALASLVSTARSHWIHRSWTLSVRPPRALTDLALLRSITDGSLLPCAIDVPESRQSPPNAVHRRLQIRIGFLAQRDELEMISCGSFAIAPCFMELAQPPEKSNGGSTSASWPFAGVGSSHGDAFGNQARRFRLWSISSESPRPVDEWATDRRDGSVRCATAI